MFHGGNHTCGDLPFTYSASHKDTAVRTKNLKFGLIRPKDRRKSSQQMLSICGNSFKTVGKAFPVKLVERMPRVCKAVIKAKGGYFEYSKIYVDLFNTFLVTTGFHMCY
jgi:hypothetical protein